jgi:hypothetical protein
MGKLIKHQWARLIVLTAGACTVLFISHSDSKTYHGPHSGDSSILKLFSTCLHRTTPSIVLLSNPCSIFNPLVAPIPIIQIINLITGLFLLAYEWPLPFFSGTAFHRAFALRFALYPIISAMAFLQYQCTDPSFYLLIGTAVYIQAWSEGEVIGVTGAVSGLTRVGKV